MPRSSGIGDEMDKGSIPCVSSEYVINSVLASHVLADTEELPFRIEVKNTAVCTGSCFVSITSDITVLELTSHVVCVFWQ
jgi:hypothetical protein